MFENLEIEKITHTRFTLFVRELGISMLTYGLSLEVNLISLIRVLDNFIHSLINLINNFYIIKYTWKIFIIQLFAYSGIKNILIYFILYIIFLKPL